MGLEERNAIKKDRRGREKGETEEGDRLTERTRKR